MSLYYNINTYEIKEIEDSLVKKWEQDNNPKYLFYEKLPTKPEGPYEWINGNWIPMSIDALKEQKLNQLTENTQTLINNGWATPYGWKLGLSIEDIALLNGNFTLAKEAAFMGIADPVFVIDTDGESHEFNIQDLTILMLQYGQARAAVSSQDAAKRKAIKTATSIEELNDINV
jgi:hypothetical protein